MRNYIHISTTLDKNLLERVNEFCEKAERTKSWIISKAVEKFLDEKEAESVFSTDEWNKIAELSGEKGKSFLTTKQAKRHLSGL
ncbi:MAG: CopG family transcriptional regulator [Planctomycetes bacterium]|nr:CopG family transcriptional regulator [Planctomycetota bacterium]